MKAGRVALLEGYEPRLFSSFDPSRSFLTEDRPRLRDPGGKEFLDVDESIEILLLGYGALRQIGGKKLPSPSDWEQLLDSVKQVMRSHVPGFDFRKAALRGDERIESVEPFTYTIGPLEIMLMNDEQVQADLTNAYGLRAGEISGLLSLMWLDQGLGELRDTLKAIDCLLRARHVLGEALLQESRVALKRELALAGAKSKLAKDPKQLMMQEAKVLWSQNRTGFKSRAKLAQFIQSRLPDLESEANLVRRIGEWEKQGTPRDS